MGGRRTETLENIFHEGIHNGHCRLGYRSFGVNLFEDLKDISSTRVGMEERRN